MGAHSGPEIVNNGLVFTYDMSNPDKSWKGAPTTNLITNPLPNGTTTGFAAIGGVGTLTYDTQNQAIKWVRTSYEVWGAYHTITPIFNGTLSTSVQYSISFEWKVEGNTFSNNVYTYELVQGNAVSPAGTANLAANSTLQPNGWFLFKYTFTPANAGVGDAYNRIYFPSQSANASTFYWRKIQFEQRAFSTPFVNGTRSNTQALLDPIGNNTITAISLTYNSNGSISFDGVDDYVSVPITTGQVRTVCMTYKLSDPSTGWGPLWRSDDWKERIFPNTITLINSNGTYYNLNGPNSTTNIVNIAYSYNGTNAKSYLNGVLQSNITMDGPMDIGTYTYNFGRQAGGSTVAFTGMELYNVQFYNTQLTDEQVSQNFNALRGRYGI